MMSYEVLVLKEEWFFELQGPDHFKVLTEIINKGYSKARDRYKIVASPRICSPEHFLTDLHLKKGHNVTAAILLGSEDAWKSIEQKLGFSRTFNADITSDTCSYDSDVPPPILQELGSLTLDNVKFIEIKKGQVIDALIKERVLATTVVQVLDAYKIGFSEKELQIPQFELTGYSAFGRQVGATFLDFTVEIFLANRSSPYIIDHDLVMLDRVFLCCNVIKEHNLVEYYTKKCNFKQTQRPDLLISLLDSSVRLEDSMKFNKDFHVSFLHREIIPHD